MKHTPGPWYKARMGNDSQGLIVEEKTGRNVAVSYDVKDAHLVAAAPEMYEAITDFLRYAENGKHPSLANYLHTTAGAKMKASIENVEASSTK